MNAFDYFFENSQNLDKDFLLSSKETLGYSSLYKQSNQLASYINKIARPGENILLLSHNNIFFVTAYLAILKSGRTCVPLNPDVEQSNLDYITKECQSTRIFVDVRLRNRVNLDAYQVITNEDIDFESMNYAPVNSNSFDADTCAEIIFTSGSTGEPKGVMLSHKNLIANTDSIVEYLKLTQDDRMLVVLPFYYCYGLSLLHTHLRCGGSIVLNNSFIFIGAVLNDLKKHECTGFAGVPSHFQILLRKSESFKTADFPALRYVTQAGGKLHTVFIEEFTEAQPNIKFYVMYGQTEATARLSYLPIEMLKPKLGSIGKGIPGVELKVVDENGQAIKAGGNGEIIAKGDNVMLGYINDDKLTNKTIKDGWLYTGDLGTIDEDGYIFLQARSKEIIKVGGKRVSPKEIEEVIVSIPEVIDCTIFAIQDDLLGEAIKANIVVDKAHQETITVDFIKDYCAKQIAPYKIPQVIDIQDRVSMSATGKKVKSTIS